MTQSLPKLVLPGPPQVLTVLLDGCIVGCIPSSQVEKVVAHIREFKVSFTEEVCFCLIFSASFIMYYSLGIDLKIVMQIPDDLEVGYVPLSMGGAYPGIYLFTSPSRFVRPVRNLSIPSDGGENIELIGPFEQVNIDFMFCASYNCLEVEQIN